MAIDYPYLLDCAMRILERIAHTWHILYEILDQRSEHLSHVLGELYYLGNENSSSGKG